MPRELVISTGTLSRSAQSCWARLAWASSKGAVSRSEAAVGGFAGAAGLARAAAGEAASCFSGGLRRSFVAAFGSDGGTFAAGG
jgi:hypothetical protein